jgi:regulator of protease activity HflC (stomatin/prohibitin superfamily)
MSTETIVFLGLLFVVIVVLLKTAVVVPQKSAYIVERLGKYANTLGAGFHILVPFVDHIAYKHTLKEEARDVPPQSCITKDNVAITVDGILYLQVIDRQDRTRPHVRGTRHHQRQRGRGRGQGFRSLGHQDHALRDQDHRTAPEHQGRDGETDARRA